MAPAYETFEIAAVQATPCFLDLERTIDKACGLIEQAGKHGSSLVVFPEAFVPAYPLWAWFVPPGHTKALRELYAELHANSVSVPGPAVSRLAEAAADVGIAVAIGVNETNSEASGSSLYNTLLFLGADGTVLGKHRKLVPTAAERLIWSQGDGSDMEVYTLPFGRVGGLICWENYMPLARYTLAARGEQIHVAPTWDRGEPWISSMRHIAKESRCYVVSCCQAFHKDDVPDSYPFKAAYLAGVDGWLNPGHSLIVDPDGKLLAGPANEEETILYAQIETQQFVGPRWQLDIAGHYARPDVFELRVRRKGTPMLSETSPPATDIVEPA